jgi:hypothetical protein
MGVASRICALRTHYIRSQYHGVSMETAREPNGNAAPPADGAAPTGNSVSPGETRQPARRPAPAGIAVAYRPLRALAPYARNARTHSPAQVAKLRASLARFGWTNPMLIAGGALIAGHARLQAALAMAEAGEAIAGNADPWAGPTIDLSHLTAAERRAYVIADNRLAEDAGWDAELLRLEMGELALDGFDLALTGFEPLEIADMLGGGETGEGGVPGAGSLADRFGVPPFSVLNAREGWWQDRKRAWIALGIQSELGRGATPGTSARVGPDDEPTYRTIGGSKANAVPGGSPRPLDRAKNARRNSIADPAAPGGSLMPAMDYRKSRTRGDGRGEAVE